MSERKSEDGKLYTSVSNTEVDSDRPNIEDYLSESLPEPHGKLRLYSSFSLLPLSFFFLLFDRFTIVLLDF